MIRALIARVAAAALMHPGVHVCYCRGRYDDWSYHSPHGCADTPEGFLDAQCRTLFDPKEDADDVE